MEVPVKLPKRALHEGAAIRRRWRRFSYRDGLKRSLHVAGVGRQDGLPTWIAIMAAARQASSRPLLLARQRAVVDAKRVLRQMSAVAARPQGGSSPQIRFAPGERRTLEAGSWVVLGALGLGVQFCRWPAWSALLAVGGYLTWVLLYAEITVQAQRHSPSPRGSARPGARSGAATTTPPGEEKITS